MRAITFSFLLWLLRFEAVVAVSVNYSSITNSKGDHIPDFSFCGYRASIETLPSTSGNVKKTLTAGSGDQTSTIQTALTNVSSSGGGVVLLDAGNYTLDSGLTIPNGTTLRGSGVGKTYLKPKDGSFNLIVFGGTAGDAKTGSASNITEDYVAVGASEVNVFSTSDFSVGQTIYVEREVTQSWIDAQGMGDLVRNDAPQIWIAPGTLIQQPRSIKSIQESTITLDIPLTDSIDKMYDTGCKVVAYTAPSTSTEMGLEELSIELSPSCSGASIDDTSCATSAILVSPWVTDSWIRNLAITGVLQSISISTSASRITVDSISMYRNEATNTTNGSPADITVSGTQVLVANCKTYGDEEASSFSVVTEAMVAGPNAVVNHTTQQTSQAIMPHQRWAHGFLVDNSSTTVSYINRGIDGSGQGWAINTGVAWNVESPTVDVMSSPLGTNYCIGCKYTTKASGSNGTFDYPNESIDPPSLFAAQLAARDAS